MATVLVKVKLDWNTCFVPGANDTKLSHEKKVIGRDHIEHRWCVRRYFYWAHTAINRSDEIEIHYLRVDPRMHGETSYGRETNHSRLLDINPSFLSSLKEHIIGSFCICQLIREVPAWTACRCRSWRCLRSFSSGRKRL